MNQKKLTRRAFFHNSAAALGAGVLAQSARGEEAAAAPESLPFQPAPDVVPPAPAEDCAEPAEATSTSETPTASIELKQRPNVVLIIMDTCRQDKLSCYGYPHPTSPALDKLAEDGVRFERAISQCSWTRPSCGSFLTSRFPRTIGLYKEEGEMLGEQFPTIGRVLQQNGYRTIGMTANPNLNTLYNFHLGFDTYIDSNVIFPWMEAQPGDKIRSVNSGLPKATEMFEKALRLLKEPTDKPSYVQINAMEIHEWYISRPMIRPEYRRMFLDAKERYPKYLQSVRQLTDDIGNFVEDVRALPGFEDTLFILVSDHGEGLDSHKSVRNSLWHGWLLYESNVVVPLIFSRKGWNPPSRVVTQPIRLLELMPTLLDMLGIEKPGDIHGVSVNPLLDGSATEVELPRYLITETHWRAADKIAAYDPKWKYFNNRTRQPLGLPPRELQEKGGNENGIRTNQLPKHPKVAVEMASFLIEWEKKYPKADPIKPERELTEDEKSQLEAIGYLGGDESFEGELGVEGTEMEAPAPVE